MWPVNALCDGLAFLLDFNDHAGLQVLHLLVGKVVDPFDVQVAYTLKLFGDGPKVVPLFDGVINVVAVLFYRFLSGSVIVRG